ncbi:VRR-NUC domain-containing protein [Sphingobacterium sp. InxBP1]|uniref:VRR-NUC domain-containing protein n=1 Tax=Sphingobacterium sp. InxBP1 TaxID=2870328 RepID=UPI0022447F79|nr:VRR-NUC domain-containing protein [Sphingobacterium sp. InxBP1]MCW8314197.1 VRR-NUC domain-containing protein [Sphingobacterium sp. InxBP1]
MTEEQLQAKIFQYMWNYYPSTRRKFFHVANELPNDAEYVLSQVQRHVGSQRWFTILRESIRKRIGMFLSRRRASGIVPGIPDMILINSGRAFGFELKTEEGTVSPAQKEVHKTWSEDGTPVWVIRSLEEYLDVIVSILGQPEIKKAS